MARTSEETEGTPQLEIVTDGVFARVSVLRGSPFTISELVLTSTHICWTENEYDCDMDKPVAVQDVAPWERSVVCTAGSQPATIEAELPVMKLISQLR